MRFQNTLGKPSRCGRVWAVVLLFFASTAINAGETPKNVLVLYSDNRIIPATALFDETLQVALRKESVRPISIFNEFLDLDRLSNADFEAQLESLLRAKYQNANIGVIVAGRLHALQFMIRHPN